MKISTNLKVIAFAGVMLALAACAMNGPSAAMPATAAMASPAQNPSPAAQDSAPIPSSNGGTGATSTP